MPVTHYLEQALFELVGNLPIKQRLISAYSKYLQHIDADDLPDGVHEEFAALCRELVAVTPLPGESPVQATVRKMSPADTDSCALRLAKLVAGYLQAGHPATVRTPREARPASETVIPLFAAEA